VPAISPANDKAPSPQIHRVPLWDHPTSCIWKILSTVTLRVAKGRCSVTGPRRSASGHRLSWQPKRSHLLVELKPM
jgi:hypothetical protein